MYVDDDDDDDDERHGGLGRVFGYLLVGVESRLQVCT